MSNKKFVSFIDKYYQLIQLETETTIKELINKNSIIKYDDLFILFVNLNDLDDSISNSSIYKILLDNFEYITNFLEFINDNINDFSIDNNSFNIFENKIYYKNIKICNLLDYESDCDKLELLKYLFIDIPYTSFQNCIIPVTSTPIFLILKLYLNIGQDKLKNYLLECKRKIEKMYDYLSIELPNLPLQIFEINYIPKRVFDVINNIIIIFEKNFKVQGYDNELNNYLNIKNHCFKITYDSIKKIIECLKENESFDKNYQNLYEELINYL